MSETTTQTTEATEQPTSIFEQPLSDAPALVVPKTIMSAEELIKSSLKVSPKFDDQVIIDLWEKHHETLVQEFNKRLAAKRYQVSRITDATINILKNHRNYDYTPINEHSEVSGILNDVVFDAIENPFILTVTIPLTAVLEEIKADYGLATKFSNVLDLNRLKNFIGYKLFMLIAKSGYEVTGWSNKGDYQVFQFSLPNEAFEPFFPYQQEEQDK